MKKENFRGGRVWIKNIFPVTTQDVNLLKRFFATYMAFREFAHILWEAPKPTIVLTDNKLVTRFF